MKSLSINLPFSKLHFEFGMERVAHFFSSILFWAQKQNEKKNSHRLEKMTNDDNHEYNQMIQELVVCVCFFHHHRCVDEGSPINLIK